MKAFLSPLNKLAGRLKLPLPRLRRATRSDPYALPAAVVALAGFEVYLPDQTLTELARMGVRVRDAELLAVVRESSRSGGAEPLQGWVERRIAALQMALERGKLHVENVMNAMLTFSTTLTLMIAGVSLIARGGAEGALLPPLVGLAFTPIILAIYPPELRVPASRRLLYLAALPALAFLGLALSLPLLPLLAALSIPGAVIAFLEDRVYTRDLEFSVKAIERAAATPFAVWEAIGRKPGEMPQEGLPGVFSKGLHLIERFGGDAEEFSKLWQLASTLHKAFTSLRGKAWAYAALALVNALICGVSYAILAYVAQFLAGAVGPGVAVPGAGVLVGFVAQNIDSVLTLAMAVNSLALSLVVAEVRHGNPLYFTLYLPLYAIAHYASWLLGLQLAPSLVGG
ncbi:hypothetical protein [Infirmifilum sp. SLHALR2]|nr:MAG: hypothetical protein B7L53_09750 [Thermofilum sp. NZ13]